MAENAPSPEERPKSRWPLILGGLVGGFLLLAAVAAAGYGLGRSEARAPFIAPSGTPDPCEAEAAIYAKSTSSSNAGVFVIARDDYQKCRAAHP